MWNDLVVDIKRTTVPFVLRKIESVMHDKALPQKFHDVIQWDVVGVCMEAEYADVFPPGFYAVLGYWYTKGHFPCGWEGEFPGGRIIVF